MKYLTLILVSSYLFFSTSSQAYTDLKVASIIEPPFSRIENDRIVGFNVEVTNVLAASVGLKPVFVQCPFARCLAMVEQGKADLMIGLSKRSDREENLLFIEPALFIQNKPLSFHTLASQKINITNLADLDQLIVGTIRGATYFPAFDNNNQIKKIELTSQAHLLNMLLKGRIDTFMERPESIQPLLTPQEYQDKIRLSDYQYSQPMGSYIVVSKHSPISAYADALSIQLKRLIDSGVISQLQTDYLHATPE